MVLGDGASRLVPHRDISTLYACSPHERSSTGRVLLIFLDQTVPFRVVIGPWARTTWYRVLRILVLDSRGMPVSELCGCYTARRRDRVMSACAHGVNVYN